MLLELSSSVLSQSESSGLRPCEEEQKRSEGRGLSSSALTNTGGFILLLIGCSHHAPRHFADRSS